LVVDSVLPREENLDKLRQTAIKWIIQVPVTVCGAQIAVAQAQPSATATFEEGSGDHVLTSTYKGGTIGAAEGASTTFIGTI
jgi:hypothetical protein